jgi:phosphate transport system substrate-binding protein
MPPEVLASLAEQSYSCVEGDTQVHAIDTVATVATDWQFSVESACPGMTITPSSELTSETALQIFRADATAAGTSFSEVPFALDAVVFAVSLADISNVNLSADAIGKIWSGEITNWNDEELATLNPNFELPDVAISFGVDGDVGETKSFLDWMNRLAGKEISVEGGSASFDDFVEGSLVLTKYSKASEQFASMVGIVTEAGGEGVVPSMETVLTAATMFKTKTESGKVVLTFDPKAKAIAPQGIATAPVPYQAVTLITLALVGEDTLKTRAAAKFLLRQDSQGSLGLSSVIALPEMLRAVSLAVVSVGLPLPTIAPE